MPSSLPGEKCVPSSIVFWFLDKCTYMIANSERIHGPSQLMNHYLHCKARGMGCFVLFLPSQDKFMEKLVCMCYTIILQMTRLKCFELAPGVHSTTLGLAFKSSLCSSSLQPSSQKRKAQELQNWTEAKSLILKIQSHFYATSGQNDLTKFYPKGAIFTTFSVQKSFGALFTSDSVQIN